MNTEEILSRLGARLDGMAAENDGFCGWELVSVDRTGEQRLCDGGEGNRLVALQSRHAVRERTVSVQVYVRHGSPERMGTSSTTLDPLGDEASQLRATLAAARSSGNPPWALPVPGGAPSRDVRECDPGLAEDLAGATDALLARVDESCRGLAGVRVNSAELYADVCLRRQWSSTGIRVANLTSELYLECAMERAGAGHNTQEVHNQVRGVHRDSLDAASFLRDAAEETRALGEVRLPQTDGRAVVVVRADALNQVLHALAAQLDFAAEYHKRPHLAEGQAVSTGACTGDALDLSVDPFLDYMAESGAYTREGLPAQDGPLVRGGLVVGRTGSHRMAQYLGRPFTGVCGNLVVPAGTWSLEQMLSGAPRVVEVKSFSSLLVSPDTLTWSSELKLARLWENGKAVAWLKGGVMAGELRKNFAAVRWSRETRRVNQTADAYHPAAGYEGPAWACFMDGVSISGG